MWKHQICISSPQECVWSSVCITRPPPPPHMLSVCYLQFERIHVFCDLLSSHFRDGPRSLLIKLRGETLSGQQVLEIVLLHLGLGACVHNTAQSNEESDRKLCLNNKKVHTQTLLHNMRHFWRRLKNNILSFCDNLKNWMKWCQSCSIESLLSSGWY